jgi:hypothetical protein
MYNFIIGYARVKIIFVYNFINFLEQRIFV